MMVLVVTLDLLGPATAYDPLYEQLKKLGTWWHYMRWTWLLDTDLTPDQVVAAIRPHMQAADRALVTQLTAPYQGMLTREEWSWIDARMNKQRATS